MENNNTVYLAGLISTEFPDSLKWRILVAPILERAGFSVLSPLRGKSDLQQKTNDGGMNYTGVSSKNILLRDWRDVTHAKVVLCHLESFGSERPLLGTIAEVAWCWEKNIPVIGIADKENILMREHPFMKEFIAAYFTNEIEACQFIIKYYGTNDIN